MPENFQKGSWVRLGVLAIDARERPRQIMRSEYCNACSVSNAQAFVFPGRLRSFRFGISITYSGGNCEDIRRNAFLVTQI